MRSTAPELVPVLEDNPRGRPRTIGGVIYLAIVAMAAVGMVLAVAGAWRTGIAWMGAGLLIGAVSRLVLTERGAGMLRVRRRVSDVVMLTVAGVGLVVLSFVVPYRR
jgi:hypothetical protein